MATKAKYDYEKITLDEMSEWIEENADELVKDEKLSSLFFDFLDKSLGEKDKKMTLSVKKTFYLIAKEKGVAFDHAPQEKAKKKDPTVDRINELRAKYKRPE